MDSKPANSSPKEGKGWPPYFYVVLCAGVLMTAIQKSRNDEAARERLRSFLRDPPKNASPDQMSKAGQGPAAPSREEPASREAREFYQRGFDAGSKKNFGDAINYYSEAIRLAPNYSSAYVDRSWAYASIGNYDAAIADSTKAIALQPDSITAYMNRAAAHYCKGEYSNARADLTEVIRRRPDFGKAYCFRALAEAPLGLDAEADSDWSKGAQLDPKLAEKWLSGAR